jgi:hypothetical protein
VALVLQNGSGPSSDFLAKILGVDTPPFLWKTDFFSPTFFTVASKSRKLQHFHIVSNSSGGCVLAYGAADPCSFPFPNFAFSFYYIGAAVAQAV